MSDTPHVISGSIDNRVLVFNFALSLATGLLFGLVPALRSTKPNLAPTLKDQVGAVVGGGGGVRLRKGLVVAQVTVSVLLLIGAGLFIRSLRNLRLLDLGLKTDNLIAFNLVADAQRLHAAAHRSSSTSRCSIASARCPASPAMAFAQMGLLEGNEWDSSMSVEGYEAKPGENMNPYCNAVSPGYFKTMGIPLVAGRDFDDRDARFEAGRSEGAAAVATRWRSSTRATRSTTSAIAARSAATSASASTRARRRRSRSSASSRTRSTPACATRSRARCSSPSWRTTSPAAR